MANSDRIAKYIMQSIECSAEGCALLQRSALAERFSCVPSQINYVLATRFSPERGYLVESRRGGGGYIRVSRVRSSPQEMMMHTVNAVGERLDSRTVAALVSNLHEAGLLDQSTARLLLSAVGDQALRQVPPAHRETVRAGIFKQMLVTLGAEQDHMQERMGCVDEM